MPVNSQALTPHPPKATAGEGLLASLTGILSPEHVLADDATLDRYSRTNSIFSSRPACVVRPADTAQVQAVVRAVAAHEAHLHPISAGRNWGYGSACATRGGAVILDLGRMNRIIEINEELAYCVIEPGVTQGDLYKELRRRGSRLWCDVTGAGLGASLTGNTLDRGFGHTRYGDHVASSLSLQIVLADASVIDTGYGRFQNARAQYTYPYGVGPSLDGLFGQANLGIVTRMGLWLMPEPEAFAAFFLLAPDDRHLEPILDALAPLRLAGLLQSTIHVGNDLRVLSARTRYPFDRTGGQTPLPHHIRDDLRREAGVGRWNAAGAIYGTPGTVRETKRAIRRATSGLGVTLRFLDDRLLNTAKRLHRGLKKVGKGRRLGERLALIEPSYGILKGIPTDEPLRGAGWRVRGPMPEEPTDPRDEGAGLMWVSPVLPIRGRDARELLDLMEPIYAGHGFDTLVTFTMINERSMICVSNIAFDKSLPEEVAAAESCYRELWKTLMGAGFVPYRTGPAGFDKLLRADDATVPLLAKIKQSLDPQGVISPGRYGVGR